MAKVKSCGFIIFRNDPSPSFLLMRHPNRWDLPKGHVDPGETNLQCALRELEEETGITNGDITIDEEFKFKHSYVVKYTPEGDVLKTKKLIVFLAQLHREVRIRLTEHESYEWREWNPPHKIQDNTIDPLLEHLAGHWQSQMDVA